MLGRSHEVTFKLIPSFLKSFHSLFFLSPSLFLAAENQAQTVRAINQTKVQTTIPEKISVLLTF